MFSEHSPRRQHQKHILQDRREHTSGYHRRQTHSEDDSSRVHVWLCHISSHAGQQFLPRLDQFRKTRPDRQGQYSLNCYALICVG